MKLKINKSVLILAISSFIAVIIIMTKPSLAPSQIEPFVPIIRVIESNPMPVRLKVNTQGTIQPRTETMLVPEVSGNVVWISDNLVAGGFFQENEPLLEIDDRDYIDAVEMAKANVYRAEAENEYAKFELERLEELINRELISLSELERGVRAARVSEASLNNAILSLERSERDLERTKILAPFSGLVKNKQIDLGQFITRGVPIANIYSDDYVEVNLPIADQQLAYLNLPITQRGELLDGDAPNVTLFSNYGGKKYEWIGKLVRTEAEIDIRSRMVQTVARIYNNYSNNDYLAPPIGLFVQAEIEGLLVDNIVTIPRSALRGENLVLVVDQEERLYQREVSILRLYGDDVFISGGLNQGELICISPIQTFIDGMKVKTIIEENYGTY
ncbi:MAG: efflux RND transporter periplasmic adaptor subunit [Pseudomonadota bacterium]|nr:hypothetical protein [Gammaproteobacteria bacterium]MEE2683684.1 efflux RND transporter periplasmic adaptor subunit [Pseudomonadota bacterium]|tara:strand:- start:289 stop:1452 length:1164 start_codon:yes stop_codon:yes gene_type:complete